MDRLHPGLSFVHVIGEIRRERLRDDERRDALIVDEAARIEQEREAPDFVARLREDYGPFTAIKNNAPRGLVQEVTEIQ